MELFSLVERWDHLFAAIIGFSGVFGLGYKFVFTPLRNLINRIIDEFSPNGGKSLRDAIDIIKHDIADIAISMGFTKERLRLTGQREQCGEWESDVNGGCIYAGQGLTKITGYPADFWLGNNWASVIVEKDRNRVWEEWRACVKEQRRFEMEYAFYTSIGTCVKVHAKANPVFNKQTLIGFVGEICPLGGCSE